jgi:transcriptional regulator with XRE-family HTH domain
MLRTELNLTQAQAAELAKLDQNHWQDIERARTNPTVATLVGVARALSITLSELFDPPQPLPPSQQPPKKKTREP